MKASNLRSTLRHGYYSPLLKLTGALVLLSFGIPLKANAAPNLTIQPISWGVVGLDSNRVTDGPDTFNTGARVCNVGSSDATNVKVTFTPPTGSTYMSLAGNTTLSLSILPPGATSLPPGNTGAIPDNCKDFYFNVKVNRNSSAYDTKLPYQINATADTIGTVSTPSNRELYVEKLVSQNRNSITAFVGAVNVEVGRTYTYTVSGSTAPGGYEQLVFATNFPNTAFQVLGVQTTYTQPTGTSNNTNYGDGCGWNAVTSSPTYQSCIGPANYTGGKVGANFVTTYAVRILSTGTATVTNLVYDFSGSSYHYNSDYGTPITSKTITATNASAYYSISGTLYKDNNFNSINDSEPALGPNVMVQLYTDTNNNNIIDFGEEVSDPVQTNASGQYSFTSIPSGTYKIKAATNDSDIPSGYTLRTPNNIVTSVSANVTDQNFGFAPPTISVSGTVWDDANGSANGTFTGIQNGTETGTNAGGLNAVLVDSTGKVIATTPITTNGIYTFGTVATSQSNVTLRLSTTAGTIATTAPSSSVPSGWIGTSPLTTAAFNIGTTNITSREFGIEQLPDTNNVTAASQTNPSGTVTVQVPTLSGTDPEDGTLGSGKKFKIVTLPSNGALYYNGVAVTVGQVITVYDQTKLTIDPNDGNITVSFTYAAIDAASKEDPTPATVVIPFGTLVPNLRLVKRLTKIQTTTFSNYIDVVTGGGATDDNAPNWVSPSVTATKSDSSGTTPNFSALLQGIISSSTLPISQQPKPLDDVEYTVYFLSDGGANAQNVTLCDFVPNNSTYVPNSLKLSIGAGAPTVISDATGGADIDGGFYPNLSTFPIACSTGTNKGNGAVVVNVGTVDRSTGSGTPTTSYGFIRFRAKVD